MLFLLLNLVLFIGSLLLTYSAISNIGLFLSLPLGLEILILIGIITPLMNIYDIIKNFVILYEVLTYKDE